MKKKTHKGGALAAAITHSQVIKVGLDVHADSIVAVRIVDGQSPERAKRFLAEAAFFKWIKEQALGAAKVFTCYEAGPLGYSLHRQLADAGITNYVVRPRDWDEYGSKVKTDNRDAHELALCLDRYVSGNNKAFSVVRVPSPAQEQDRSVSRHRKSLQQHKQRLAAQGRGNALYFGHRLKSPHWWKGRAWKEQLEKAPAHVLKLLESLRNMILSVEEELKSYTQELEESVSSPVPYGVGKLTAEMLDREVGDWHRFKNRRQVGSYTGLCPSEDSSGSRRFQGHINKHGNRRLRPLLIECTWRLVRCQGNYRLVRKWSKQLCDPKTSKARRKQIIVAIARAFAVDWWRMRTGQAQAKDLGLV